eukprot:9475238-Pyramimonas_sp.AAC.1
MVNADPPPRPASPCLVPTGWRAPRLPPPLLPPASCGRRGTEPAKESGARGGMEGGGKREEGRGR